MKKFVYLAGPILNQTKHEANDWRKSVDRSLEIMTAHMVVGVSPLRCEPLVGERYSANYPDEKFGTARAIASKNIFDVRTCDMTLAYLPKPTEGRHQSYGTIIEVAWAHAFGKPVIVVSDDPRVLEHPVINVCAGWMLPTLEDAVEVIVGVLGGYTGGKHV